MREDLLETKGCVCFRLDPPHKSNDSRPFGFLEKRRAAQMFIPLNPPKADLLLRGPEASRAWESMRNGSSKRVASSCSVPVDPSD